MKHLRAFAALATIAPLLVPGVSLGQEDPKAPAEPEDAQGAPAQKEPPPDNGSSPSAINVARASSGLPRSSWLIASGI